MLKVLIIPAFRLYPIDSGGAHAQLAFLENMQEGQEIDIIITPDNIGTGDLTAFRKRFPKLNLILSGYSPVNKEAKVSAFFKKLSRKLSGKDHGYKLRKFGLLNGLIHTRPALLEEIRRIAAEKDYDIIQAEHSINMGVVELLPVKPKKIFVHHEISHTRIKSDMQSLGLPESYVSHISGIAANLEKSWLNLYDGIITLSRQDAELLQMQGVDRPVQVAEPFALFSDELKNIYDPSLPPRLLFVGGESHYPNKEGLEWFLKEVYPLVKKQYADPGIRITGSWTGEFKDQFATDNSIQFVGFVPALDEVYRDSILVAPVRIGSGVRIKVITALAQGAPVVGTSLGVSGIPGILHGENVLIADDPNLFAVELLSILQDAEKRKSLAANGFSLAQKGYNSGAFSEERHSFYLELLGKGKQVVQTTPIH